MTDLIFPIEILHVYLCPLCKKRHTVKAGETFSCRGTVFMPSKLLHKAGAW